MGVIFHIQADGKLVEMKEELYKSEDFFQGILADYPNLLSGDQIDTQQPRRWLLVTREIPIPAQEGGAGQWSLDHLFVDQDGVPTIVEVKRSTDTRIRREVVGQMLDYAANCVLYWPVDFIRQRFDETCRERGVEPGIVVAEFIGFSGTAEIDAAIVRFWEL